MDHHMSGKFTSKALISACYMFDLYIAFSP